MRLVNNIALICFITLLGTLGRAQSSEKLKKEQERIEKQIASTKSLLSKSKSNTQTSLSELRLIENQINYRERLLQNYDNQIRSAELNVQQKEQQIQQLKKQILLLKEQYRKLLIFAYKHRNKYGKMMYIFTADSYHEAKKRTKYLRRFSDIQLKQYLVIIQHQHLIREEIGVIQKEKENKLLVVEEKRNERVTIEKDRERKEKIYQNFKQAEEELLAKLRKEEQQRERLRNEIAAAIRKELAEAEARRKREAEARKKETTASTSADIPAEAETVMELASTRELELASKSFEGNRGRLPWPVSKGSIIENFGKNAHPTLKNVYTNNRGIDIGAPRNAQVRAVFDGEVTSVLNIPGAGKVVIIKHGNYRTVYSNLQDTYVTSGMKVSTKKVIGSLLVKEGEGTSVAHFEVHKVVGSSVTCLNPTLWIAR